MASRNVIVAGAGIGGLTAALALAQRGFRVTLLEQAERLEETGAGIQLYLDTGVQVGHTGDAKVIWEQDFRALNLTIDSPEIQKSHGDGDWGKVN